MRLSALTLAAHALFAGILVGLAGPATAQTEPAAPAPQQPAPALAQPAPDRAALTLSASLTGDTKPLRSGLVWRIFEDKTEETQPRSVARSTAANPTLTLPPGNYIVHVAYGFASASMPISLGTGARSERLTISAGALKLGGAIGDVPIPPNRLSFSIFLPIGNDSEGRLVIGKVKAGDIVRLPEGTYHVVSTYGDSNAIMRTDLKVDPGRLTEATLNHRAATVTLKLVAAAGGEAFAGTAFSVLTPGGDVIREAIGAFPTVTLAEGDYVLIARHDGRVYTRDFKVESGLDRDVEALVTPQPSAPAAAQPASADPGSLVPRQRP
jgi:hypothetical protein